MKQLLNLLMLMSLLLVACGGTPTPDIEATVQPITPDPTSTPTSTPTITLDLTNWVCSRWDIQPEIAVGDAKFGTERNLVGLEKAGIKAFLPIPDLGKRTKFYS